MKNKIQIPFAIVFWIVVAIDIIAVGFNISFLHFIAKCLLMPLLFLLLLFNSTTAPQKKILLTGLFFSWCGDVLLLFDDRQPWCFIFGLACFLITHILYIVYFLKITSSHSSLLKKQPLLIAVVVGYGVALVSLLFPHLGDLTIPVIVYAAVICSMLLCSLHIFLKAGQPANRFFLLGAILFVLSDSILAINKFYQSFTFAAMLIMLTYCMAQYFIVKGFIKQPSHD